MTGQEPAPYPPWFRAVLDRQAADVAAAFDRLLGDEPVVVVQMPPRTVKIGQRLPVSLEEIAAVDPAAARRLGWTPPPPIPARARRMRALRRWWWQHRPRLHLGPCPRDYEED